MKRFAWMQMGRSMVARVGPLSLAVDAKGSAAAGTKRWRIGSIFGQWHHNREQYENLDDAIRVAEEIAVRLLAEATVALQATKVTGPDGQI